MTERSRAADAMRQAMERIMTGAMPPEEIRAFLTTLAARGETAEELAAAVEVLRMHAVRLPVSPHLALCDTCGTGGDGQGTFNISTLAALVAAACGVVVAKHGNRAASSRCGSADLMHALGMNLDAPPERIARSIETLGFGFCFAPQFHPAMKIVASIRRELGIRTIFNLIGPLANPARLTFQLVGVSEARLMRPMAEALVALGLRHAMVVYGEDGLDEVTTTTATRVLEVAGGAIQSLTLTPEEFGLTRTTVDRLRGADAVRNANVAEAILQGTPSPLREIVAINAGCAIYVADRAPSIHQGLVQAHGALESGRVKQLLARVVECSYE